MKLAAAIGRDRAHAIVKELSDRARQSEETFSDAVRAHPAVREHLGAAEIEECVSYRAYLGQTRALINRVLADSRRARRGAANSVPSPGAGRDAPPGRRAPLAARCLPDPFRGAAGRLPHWDGTASPGETWP